ncbi:hypothetical protein J3459_018201 [Metarhizium acridum]|nr:hypothetical protein J3459_018201 [Metarhizium acridum]
MITLKPNMAPRPAWTVTARILRSKTTLGRRTFITTTVRFSQSQQKYSKVYKDADEAVSDVKSGSTILSSGFGLCGVADTIIQALNRRGVKSLHSLTAVSNNAGIEGQGGLSTLSKAGQVDNLILSYLGNNKALERKYLSGELAIELCPQGTLAERLRAGGAGIPAFYTPTGAHTLLQEGEIPIRLDASGKALERGKRRETREFNGRSFLLETALTGDVAILRAWKVDKAGNCVFRYAWATLPVLQFSSLYLVLVVDTPQRRLGRSWPKQPRSPLSRPTTLLKSAKSTPTTSTCLASSSTASCPPLPRRKSRSSSCATPRPMLPQRTARPRMRLRNEGIASASERPRN